MEAHLYSDNCLLLDNMSLFATVHAACLGIDKSLLSTSFNNQQMAKQSLQTAVMPGFFWACHKNDIVAGFKGKYKHPTSNIFADKTTLYHGTDTTAW